MLKSCIRCKTLATHSRACQSDFLPSMLLIQVTLTHSENWCETLGNKTLSLLHDWNRGVEFDGHPLDLFQKVADGLVFNYLEFHLILRFI